MPQFVFANISDGAVFPARVGVRYDDIAICAWLDAQWFSLNMDDYQTRIRNGEQWFATHDPTTLGYARTEVLLANLVIARRCAAMACWQHCCDVYCALTLCRDLVPEIPLAAPTSPMDVWRCLRETEPAPGAWPAVPDEAYVEGRVARVPAWQRDELRDVLARRQEGRSGERE